MSTSDKQKTAARFGLSSAQCTFPRILTATDAYGLGIDNPDVKRVVQWLLPSSMQKLYQRLSRAMRCGQKQMRQVEATFRNYVDCRSENRKRARKKITRTSCLREWVGIENADKHIQRL